MPGKNDTEIVSEINQPSSTTPRKDAAYVRARLERDGKTDEGTAELLAKVDRSEISAHKAAVEAGFRRQYIQIDAADPEREAAGSRSACSN